MNNLFPNPNSIDFIHPDDDVILNLKTKTKPKRASFPLKSEKKKSLVKKPFPENLNIKMKSYINDLIEINSVVPFCQEKNRKELLLDRGLLLCLKINEYIEDAEVNINYVLNYNKENSIEIDLKLLDENYWMNQKVDKYARTEQRKRIPQERWFMFTDNSFTPNLQKCFALNREKFIDTYNWLNSLEKK